MSTAAPLLVVIDDEPGMLALVERAVSATGSSLSCSRTITTTFVTSSNARL